MTAIIVVNWNGAEITAQCLKSLEKADGDFFVVVVDNGSTDNSVIRLEAECANCNRHQAYLYPLDENYGFAGGNNRGLAYARQYNPDSYMLLNNDTEVEPDFFICLQRFSAANKQYRVLSPRINYWYDKKRIWYSGGSLTFGSRRNAYRDCEDDVMSGKPGFRVTFVSGCALFCYDDVLEEDGKLLSERFFFSEEDYEFALRMRANGVQMACVPDSLIYHKVGQARDGGSLSCRLGKDYNYYLGRLICDRLHYRKIVFEFILLASLMKSVRVICKDAGSLGRCFAVLKRLYYDAHKKEGISRDDFQNMAITGRYFNFLK